MSRIILIVCLLIASITYGQSFAPAAGQIGSTAIHKDSTAIVGWATGITVNRGYLDISDPTLGYQSFGTDSNALGIAEGDGVSVVTLGDSGIATVTFLSPITNLSGPDFAIFENGFADNYMELAHVEVSSDGVNFIRFPSTSETPLSPQMDNFSFGDCRYLNNLAGKYRQGFGTPFDLDELASAPLLNVNAVTHVRIIDVVGSTNPLFGTMDSFGNLINDPYPTAFDAGGFDLDAVAVLHQLPVGINEKKTTFKIYPNPTSGLITVKINDIGKLRLVSIEGKILNEMDFINEIQLDLTTYNESIVFMEISSVNGNSVERIIVQ